MCQLVLDIVGDRIVATLVVKDVELDCEGLVGLAVDTGGVIDAVAGVRETFALSALAQKAVVTARLWAASPV